MRTGTATRLLLAGAVLVAGLLRLPFVGHQSLWIDETYTRDIVVAPHLSSVWSMVKASESTPPLYYWLSWLLRHALSSSSAAVLRLISALAGTLVAPAAFWAFRPRFSPRVALVIAWLCAVSPVLVWYSLDARAYALFVLLGLLSLGALWRERWALWTLASVACVWTHYFGAFFVAGQVLYVVLWRADLRRRLIAWCVPLAVLMAPLIPLISGQSTDERRSFLESRSLGTQVEQTIRQFGMGPNVPSRWLEWAGLLVFAFALACGAYVLARRRDRTALMLAVVIAVTAIPPILLTVTHIDRIYYMRNLLVLWPLVAAFAAFGMLPARGAPLVLYSALSIATVLTIQADWRYQNVDWASAAGPIRARIGDEPALIYPGFAGARVASVYLHRTATPGPVTGRRLAVIVEPARTSHRELERLPQFPGTPVPQLTQRSVVTLPHGFRLVQFEAPAPQPISQAGWQPDVFHGAPWFVVRR
jgi:mannosyltransferase